MVKNLPAMQETWVQSLGWEESLEKETHSSTLALKIPWTEKLGAGYYPWGHKESGTTERLHFQFPGMVLHPYHFCLSFCPLYFFLPPFEDNGLLFWVPDVLCRQAELFCGIYSVFKCSFGEFVGEKVVSPSYSSSILGPSKYMFSFFL